MENGIDAYYGDTFRQIDHKSMSRSCYWPNIIGFKSSFYLFKKFGGMGGHKIG